MFSFSTLTCLSLENYPKFWTPPPQWSSKILDIIIMMTMITCPCLASFVCASPQRHGTTREAILLWKMLYYFSWFWEMEMYKPVHNDLLFFFLQIFDKRHNSKLGSWPLPGIEDKACLISFGILPLNPFPMIQLQRFTNIKNTDPPI